MSPCPEESPAMAAGAADPPLYPEDHHLIMLMGRPRRFDPGKVDRLSEAFQALASLMVIELPGGPHRTEGLRKLVDAREDFVRAALC
jgi:hypothetical protein